MQTREILATMLCLILLITLTSHVKAETNNINQGKELFLTGRYNFYNTQQDLDEIITTLKKSQNYFAKSNNPFHKHYWQAQAEFVIAEIYEAKKEKRKAARSFNKSENLVKKALKRKETSDALRLLADTYMRQIEYKGGLYVITHGPKSMKLVKKAIQMNDKNYTAYNSLGTYYIQAPKIGGGDLEKGIKTLSQALDSTNKFDNFISYRWLSIAYNKQNNKDKALYNIKQALEIYPNSKWAKDTLKELRRE